MVRLSLSTCRLSSTAMQNNRAWWVAYLLPCACADVTESWSTTSFARLPHDSSHHTIKVLTPTAPFRKIQYSASSLINEVSSSYHIKDSLGCTIYDHLSRPLDLPSQQSAVLPNVEAAVPAYHHSTHGIVGCSILHQLHIFYAHRSHTPCREFCACSQDILHHQSWMLRISGPLLSQALAVILVRNS